MKKYIDDQVFQSQNYTEIGFEIAEYESCTFKNCSFLNVDLSHASFDNCTFQKCDLSMSKLIQTSFRDVQFDACKLLGMHFENCKDFRFQVYFKACNLNLASFYKKVLKSTRFIECSLVEVDFIEADLSKSVFDTCDLSAAIFENTNLSECDFTSAYNFAIHPEMNKLNKAKFSKEGIAGLVMHLPIIIE